MHFRKASSNDTHQILSIINQAKLYFKKEGINQWQDGYPNINVIAKDIQQGENYVLEVEHKIIATVMITTKKETSYNLIEEGQWLQHGSYIVIHRMAIDARYKGKSIASQLIKNAIPLHPGVKAIRIDTHENNLPMQRLLEKNGFHYCGIIYLSGNDKRKAYEKLL